MMTPEVPPGGGTIGAPRTRRRLRLAHAVLLGVLAALLALAASRTMLFRAFELQTVDQRFLLRGPRQAQTPLALVFIGDYSIEAFGHWPWSWTYHALLVDALKRAGARLVLFDVLFAEAPSPDETGLLEGATRQAGNVWYISTFNSLRPGPGASPVPLQGVDLTEPLTALRDAAAGVGSANALPDLDGTTRRMPLIVRRGEELYPSAVLGAAADLLGVPRSGVRFAPPGGIELRPPAGAPVLIPMDDEGLTTVNFLGGLEAFPVQFSYRQVLEADEHPESASIDLSLLKGRTVVVGVTFTGNTDLRSTPFSSNYPMFLIQATLLDNILRGEFLRRPPAWVTFLTCLLLGGCLGAASFALRPLTSALLALLAGAGYAGGAAATFARGEWQLETVAPLTTVAVAFGLVTVAQYAATRAEKQRALERMKHLGHLVASAAEAIFSVDTAGRFASWNAAAARIYGYGEQEVLGREWSLLVPPEAREKVDRALARLAAGEDPQNLEVPLRGRDDAPVPVEIAFSAIRDARDRVVGTSAISQDITEKKRMLEALVQAEKLAEIGRMGSGIVHEMKNPLTAITMMSDFLTEMPGIPEKGRKYAEIIQEESQRILRLSQDILAFARPKPPEMKATDLNVVIADTLLLTEYEMKKAKVVVEQSPDAGAPLAGPLVTAWVRDHGTGIPPEIIARIFEPFFSTKDEGKGTGLGLYISRNIVLEHGGRIAVASKPGEGTVFTLELPAAPDPPAAPPTT